MPATGDDNRPAAPGTLYLCATPIGNLEDITLRALRLLGEVDLIAAEDTRRTRKLLAHYDLHTPLQSYHRHSRPEVRAKLLRRLLDGQDIALVSDAGMPGISDPGYELVRAALEAGVNVVPLPGANAALSALAVSGLPTDAFRFHGFLPAKGRERRRLLEELARARETVVLYEAPHRLRALLRDLTAVCGEQRPAAVARELTKKFEQVLRGTLAELAAHFAAEEPRGEFCVVLAGAPESPPRAPKEAELRAAVEAALAHGASVRDAAREVAEALGIPRKQAYELALRLKH